jgi:hypothetical protein
VSFPEFFIRQGSTCGDESCDSNNALLMVGVKSKHIQNSAHNHLWNYMSSNSNDHNCKLICYSSCLSTCPLYTQNFFKYGNEYHMAGGNTGSYAAAGIIHPTAYQVLQSGWHNWLLGNNDAICRFCFTLYPLQNQQQSFANNTHQHDNSNYKF